MGAIIFINNRNTKLLLNLFIITPSLFYDNRVCDSVIYYQELKSNVRIKYENGINPSSKNDSSRLPDKILMPLLGNIPLLKFY